MSNNIQSVIRNYNFIDNLSNFRFPSYKGLVCKLNVLNPESLYETLRDDLGLISLKNSVANLL